MNENENHNDDVVNKNFYETQYFNKNHFLLLILLLVAWSVYFASKYLSNSKSNFAKNLAKKKLERARAFDFGIKAFD